MPGALAGPMTGFTDRSKGKGMVSSAWLQQIGDSAALAAGAGNLAVIATGAGINPGSTANDNVLAAFTIPARLFKTAGVTLQLTAMGSVSSNTNSKRLKIVMGATTAVVGSAVTGGVVVADSGAYTTAGAVGWQLMAQVCKYGVFGSNTQIALHQASIIGSVNGSLVVPSLLTLNESASFLIALTGNAATAAGDITLNWAEVFATN